MLEKLLNKKVIVYAPQYAYTFEGGMTGTFKHEGTVTAIDEKFIELNNNKIIAIKYISTIKAL